MQPKSCCMCIRMVWAYVVFLPEVAETKVSQVMDLARQHDHPLQCTMEKTE